MNIQIFGKNKCFATKAAERFFKERGVSFQYINLQEKGLSQRELQNVLQSIKDVDLLFDTKSPLYSSLNISKIRSAELKMDLILKNPLVLITPIVRECQSKKCTVGGQDSVWKNWINNER